MAYSISHPIETLHQGRNRVIDWIASWDEYLIPVAHDGYAATIIHFCQTSANIDEMAECIDFKSEGAKPYELSGAKPFHYQQNADVPYLSASDVDEIIGVWWRMFGN